jgi:hypothetical protein
MLPLQEESVFAGGELCCLRGSRMFAAGQVDLPACPRQVRYPGFKVTTDVPLTCV